MATSLSYGVGRVGGGNPCRPCDRFANPHGSAPPRLATGSGKHNRFTGVMVMTHTALIPVFTGTINNQSEQIVNARDLHAFLGVGRDFSTWLKERIEQYDFVVGMDYS